MDDILIQSVGLGVAAVMVALVARLLLLPYTVGLVVAGVILALAPIKGGVTLTHDFIFEVILPPLLFEAAINIHWKPLRRDALPVLVLAIGGTLIAASVVAAGMVLFLHWPLAAALLFGALIAATDPVAVIALFKDNQVAGRIKLLVESESLFNDGVAAVLFSVVLTWARDGGNAGGLYTGVLAVITVAGGILVGLACGMVAIVTSRGTKDYLVESTLTTVCAYGSFLLAEHFGCSGVLACVAAGLLMGNLGVLAEGEDGLMTPRGREFALALWDFIAFIANSFVFLLIGQAVAGIPFARIGVVPLLIILGLVLAARAVSVYPLCVLFARSSWAIEMREQHVLWWGGLRGALGLALALSLPANMAHREDILVATFAVVVFSVVAQGLTMPFLLRRLGFSKAQQVRR